MGFPRTTEVNNMDEQQRVLAGFEADASGGFNIVMAYTDEHHAFDTVIRATDDKAPFVGELCEQVKEYVKYSDWSDGWWVHQTRAFVGDSGASKEFIGVVPLAAAAEYYANPEVVARRIETARGQLVQRYNALADKRPLTWRDEICRTVWRSPRGKEEITLFELILSTYGFFKASGDAGLSSTAQLGEEDVKLLVKMRTTVGANAGWHASKENSSDGFRSDRRGYNVYSNHFTGLLRTPDFLEKVADAQKELAGRKAERARKNAAAAGGVVAASRKSQGCRLQGFTRGRRGGGVAPSARRTLQFSPRSPLTEPPPVFAEGEAAAAGGKRAKLGEAEESCEEVTTDDEEEVEERCATGGEQIDTQQMQE